jgi:hypothetical protein
MVPPATIPRRAIVRDDSRELSVEDELMSWRRVVVVPTESEGDEGRDDVRSNRPYLVSHAKELTSVVR